MKIDNQLRKLRQMPLQDACQLVKTKPKSVKITMFPAHNKQAIY
jgi:hypothetical protein